MANPGDDQCGDRQRWQEWQAGQWDEGLGHWDPAIEDQAVSWSTDLNLDELDQLEQLEHDLGVAQQDLEQAGAVEDQATSWITDLELEQLDQTEQLVIENDRLTAQLQEERARRKAAEAAMQSLQSALDADKERLKQVVAEHTAAAEAAARFEAELAANSEAQRAQIEEVMNTVQELHEEVQRLEVQLQAADARALASEAAYSQLTAVLPALLLALHACSSSSTAATTITSSTAATDIAATVNPTTAATSDNAATTATSNNTSVDNATTVSAINGATATTDPSDTPSDTSTTWLQLSRRDSASELHQHLVGDSLAKIGPDEDLQDWGINSGTGSSCHVALSTTLAAAAFQSGFTAFLECPRLPRFGTTTMPSSASIVTGMCSPFLGRCMETPIDVL